QVRVALSRLADRALSAGAGTVPRTLAGRTCRSAATAGHLLPGRRGSNRTAQPDRAHGGGVATPRDPGRLSAVHRRAARLPSGAEHPACARCGITLLLRRGLRHPIELLILVLARGANCRLTRDIFHPHFVAPPPHDATVPKHLAVPGQLQNEL